MEPLTLDYTAMEDAWWCLRLWYNRYHRHLLPKERGFESALLFGEAIHSARDTLARGSDLEEALKEFDRIFTTQYDEHAEGDLKRTPFIGRCLLRAYLKKWGQPRDLHTEVGAEVILPDNVHLIGRLDYVNDDPECTVTDVKTTGGLFWLPQARLNWQLVGYAYMVRELLGLAPTQVCIDAFVVPPLTKKIQALAPPENEHALNLFDNLHRRYGSLQPRDYEEWMRWVLHTANVIRSCLQNNWWPMRAPKACGRFGRVCHYDMLCKAQTPEQEQKLVEALYVVEPWHPFDNGDD